MVRTESLYKGAAGGSGPEGVAPLLGVSVGG